MILQYSESVTITLYPLITSTILPSSWSSLKLAKKFEAAGVEFWALLLFLCIPVLKCFVTSLRPPLSTLKSRLHNRQYACDGPCFDFVNHPIIGNQPPTFQDISMLVCFSCVVVLRPWWIEEWYPKKSHCFKTPINMPIISLNKHKNTCIHTGVNCWHHTVIPLLYLLPISYACDRSVIQRIL